ncbi:helix-turn-helix transcriptional regulator [Hymenobacter sp. BRD128]|uniref:helix-turn-helix domain-containing protein n=1 Tax=Hymenobacter sp. BRD128 TaxID=2675878 RepID=UPI00156707EA|nr:helix-turn-helix transcriptional regulator [Hymenobacter sp. BRD128]QKG55213.1 helix-turn-helix transcriptional regulator [Hymenobacter sp. BRD128]
MAANIFDLVEVTPEAAAFVDRSFQIADQIRHVLRQKGWTQRDLAAALGKKEPEISRMLVGTHNFTLKTLTRLEVVLGTALITTPQRVQEQAATLTVQGAITSHRQLADLDLQRLITVFEKPQPSSSASYASLNTDLEKAAGYPAAFSTQEPASRSAAAVMEEESLLMAA